MAICSPVLAEAMAELKKNMQEIANAHGISVPGGYQGPINASMEQSFVEVLTAKEVELIGNLSDLRRTNRDEQAAATQTVSDVRSRLAGFSEAVDAKNKEVQKTNSELL
jgi:hypothetical protein